MKVEEQKADGEEWQSWIYFTKKLNSPIESYWGK